MLRTVELRRSSSRPRKGVLLAQACFCWLHTIESVACTRSWMKILPWCKGRIMFLVQGEHAACSSCTKNTSPPSCAGGRSSSPAQAKKRCSFAEACMSSRTRQDSPSCAAERKRVGGGGGGGESTADVGVALPRLFRTYASMGGRVRFPALGIDMLVEALSHLA